MTNRPPSRLENSRVEFDLSAPNVGNFLHPAWIDPRLRGTSQNVYDYRGLPKWGVDQVIHKPPVPRHVGRDGEQECYLLPQKQTQYVVETSPSGQTFRYLPTVANPRGYRPSEKPLSTRKTSTASEPMPTDHARFVLKE